MIDYFYQLDYDDASIITEGHENLSDEPESPVQNKINYYENFTSAEIIPEDAGVAPGRSPNDTIIEKASAGDEGTPLSPQPRLRKKGRKRMQVKIPNLDQPPHDDVENASLPRPSRHEDHQPNLGSTKLSTNALMYAIADKYQIEDLKELARVKFAEAASKYWDSEAFASAAELVCETTVDTGLRHIVVDTVNAHRELMEKKEMKALFDSGNGLAWELLQLVIRQHHLTPVPDASLSFGSSFGGRHY